jgi:hypothetical protein
MRFTRIIRGRDKIWTIYRLKSKHGQEIVSR